MESRTCTTCGTSFTAPEGRDWMQQCINCWKAEKTREEFTLRTEKNTTILRSVFLKVAGQQLQNASPEDVIAFAQKLEQLWKSWK